MNAGRLLRWGAVAAYMAGLFLLSSWSSPVALPEGSDKLGHLVLYAGLGAVTLCALADGRAARVSAGACVGAVLIAVAYGAFDEYHQSFVAGRSSDLADLVADAAGASGAAAGLKLWVILTHGRPDE